MAFTIANWTCISASLNQGQKTVTPYGGSSTVLNSQNVFSYGSPNDAVATIAAADYFLDQYKSLSVGDWILVNGTDASEILIVASVSSTSVTTASFGAGGPIGTADIIDNAVTYAKLASPIVPTSTGLNVVYTGSSATPGTIRALKGLNVGTASVMTSGNLVGVRGEVDYVGASGGFLYGTQGKLIPTGTISGSSWNAGVFGQLDISAATINAGQMAPIWGDYGASAGTLTNQSGLYGIAMTNTTAVVTAAQLYLYGGASALMKLETNAGLSGVTYFIDAGTGAGSWGNATPPTPTKVLKISVDGTAYYLPLVAQNT